MRWWLYNILFTAGYLLMLPSFLRRMRRRGGYRANFAQRFGRYAPETRARLRSRRRIWVHAVSVGEAFVAGRLIEEFRRQNPDTAVVLSTTSSTGYAVCETLLTPRDVLLYFPWDFPWIVRRALDAVDPEALVLTESELWPNLLRECAKRGIPSLLANGRISDRSFPRYRALRFFFGPVLRSLDLLLVQFEEDRRRLLAIGADPARVRVMGTVKFDVLPPSGEAVGTACAALREAGIGESNTVLLGASTWPGEEESLLRAFLRLRRRCPGLRLVLVPRHMERGDEVEAAIRKAGLACSRRSRMLRAPVSSAPPGEPVLLADTTGELFAFCALADLVFVGKTLPPNRGGQNMIEPAALGKPVLVGPRTGNFTGVMDILRSRGAILEMGSADELEGAMERLLSNPDLRGTLGRKAAVTVAEQSGALARSAAAILACLPGRAEATASPGATRDEPL